MRSFSAIVVMRSAKSRQLGCDLIVEILNMALLREKQRELYTGEIRIIFRQPFIQERSPLYLPISAHFDLLGESSDRHAEVVVDVWYLLDKLRNLELSQPC